MLLYSHCIATDFRMSRLIIKMNKEKRYTG